MVRVSNGMMLGKPLLPSSQSLEINQKDQKNRILTQLSGVNLSANQLLKKVSPDLDGGQSSKKGRFLASAAIKKPSSQEEFGKVRPLLRKGEERLNDKKRPLERFKVASFSQGRLLHDIKLSMKGVCVGLSVLWLKEFIQGKEVGIQQAQQRLDKLKKTANDAVHGQNLYLNLSKIPSLIDKGPARGVRTALNFAELGVVQIHMGKGQCFSHLFNALQPGECASYTFRFQGKNNKTPGHATAIAKLKDGSCLFFDPNYGEYHIPKDQVVKFIPEFIQKKYGPYLEQGVNVLKNGICYEEFDNKLRFSPINADKRKYLLAQFQAKNPQVSVYVR